MYIARYKLIKKPFESGYDSAFFWSGGSVAKILSGLETSTVNQKGAHLLTGAFGSGKTWLLAHLARKIDKNFFVAAIHESEFRNRDYLEVFSEKLQLKRAFESKSAFLVNLRNRLLKIHQDQQSMLLVVDDAHRLETKILLEIYFLSNIRMQNQKMITPVFAGDEELAARLEHEKFSALSKNIVSRFSTKALNFEQTRDYIEHRLKCAGSDKKIFKKAALDKIHSRAAGNFRIINLICDHSLSRADSLGKKSISASVVTGSIQDIENRRAFASPGDKIDPVTKPDPPPPAGAAPRDNSSAGHRMIPMSLLLILFLGFGYFVYTIFSRESPRWDIEEIAPQDIEFNSKKGETANIAGEGIGERPPGAEKTEVNTDRPASTTGSSPGIHAETHAVANGGAEKSLFPPGEEKSVDIGNDLGKQPIAIYFDHNSNALSENSLLLLDKIVKYANQNKRAEILVKGYTDSTGTRSYNLTISRYRANSVKSYLIAKGIDPRRVKSFGLGPEKPIASNKTAEGRMLNRRVEIEVTVPPGAQSG